MEKDLVIFESKIRLIVREELVKVLNEQNIINEGILDKVIKTSLFAAILTLSGHNISAIGGDGSIKERGKTIQQILDEAGLTNKIKQELELNLTEQDIKTLQFLFDKEETLKKQLAVAKKNQDTKKIEELEQKIKRVFSADSFNDEQAKRILATGPVIFDYLKSLPKDKLKQIGDPREKEIMSAIQSKALSYQTQPETISKKMAYYTSNDLNDLYVIAAKEVGENDNKENTIISWAVEKHSEHLPDSFNWVDVIKMADSNVENFDSELLSHYKEKKVEEFSDSLPVFNKTGIQKENKINKLKNRLNEIRGLYV